MTTAASPLALGDPVLDPDHDELHRLSLLLQVATPRNALAVVEELQAHATTHFAREDEDLRRLGGNNAQCHLDEHAAVLKSLGEVRELFANPETPPATVERVVASLSHELLRWLPEHVHEMDSGLAAVRAKERLGGVPVRISRIARDA